MFFLSSLKSLLSSKARGSCVPAGGLGIFACIGASIITENLGPYNGFGGLQTSLRIVICPCWCRTYGCIIKYSEKDIKEELGASRGLTIYGVMYKCAFRQFSVLVLLLLRLLHLLFLGFFLFFPLLLNTLRQGFLLAPDPGNWLWGLYKSLKYFVMDVSSLVGAGRRVEFL